MSAFRETGLRGVACKVRHFSDCPMIFKVVLLMGVSQGLPESYDALPVLPRTVLIYSRRLFAHGAANKMDAHACPTFSPDAAIAAVEYVTGLAIIHSDRRSPEPRSQFAL
jgi:hypothetical protein